MPHTHTHTHTHIYSQAHQDVCIVQDLVNTYLSNNIAYGGMFVIHAHSTIVYGPQWTCNFQNLIQKGIMRGNLKVLR